MTDGVTTRGPGEELLVENRGPIRIVTLNRPDAANATNEPLHAELVTLWHDLADDDEARAIVLTGSGRAFSAGGDLDLLDRMVGDLDLRARVMAEGAEIVRAMTAVRIPIIAAVNGAAVGLGCSLASMCDLVVVEEHAYFADPHVALGLVAADGAALVWPLLTSLLRAKELILLGDRIPAADAVQLGLANRLVPEGQALAVALDLADRFAALPPQAVAETKAVLNDALRRAVTSVLEPAIEAEGASFDELAFQTNLARLRRR